MKIKEIGEFGLIGRIADMFGALTPDGWDGIGDDCAVMPLDSKRSLVITTDMLVEDVHFLCSRISPYELGRKALAVNLSDIAAMGATPTATFLSLGLPSEVDVEWCDAFFDGYRSFGVPLLGGDTTSSKSGVILNITVVGICDTVDIKRRRDAKVGDLIVVTAPLGDSAVGLRLMLSGAERDDADFKSLIDAHHNPMPFIEQGKWLGKQRSVHAMMDISDGVASDLKHILMASKCSAVVNLDEVPISDIARKVAAQMDWDITNLAVSGGEDYALLLTVAPEELSQMSLLYFEKFGTKLYTIGQMVASHTEFHEITWANSELANSEAISYLVCEGFSHF